MKTIKDFEISLHEKSKRIYNIKVSDQLLEKLLFSFNKFDLTALELKPFSRFTIAKSLDDLSNLELGKSNIDFKTQLNNPITLEFESKRGDAIHLRPSEFSSSSIENPSCLAFAISRKNTPSSIILFLVN